ncbi:hypothetical protein Pla52o_32920 [Novipirellula galeiformis]|uniref:Uncharacterized protein n=1 Tax=Novipirellula galeiformis TaxID=2528004 RepID=A0A5C6CG70_9BACT|nr:hypothetical protein Pla52o_32920 [Novipirellula galeiformis]
MAELTLPTKILLAHIGKASKAIGGWHEWHEGWESELKQFCESYQLASAETARRGGAIELVYRLVPKADGDAVQLIASLNAIPTVESAAAKVLYAWATKSLDVSWQFDRRCQSPRFPLGDPAIKIGKMIDGQND